MQNIIFITFIIINTVIGVLVWTHGKKKPDNILFLIITILLSWWIASLLNLYVTRNLLAIRWTFPSCILLAYTLVAFSYTFPKSTKQKSYLLKALVFPALVFLYSSVFTDYFVSSYKYTDLKTIVNRGFLYKYYLIYFIGCCLFFMAHLFYKYRTALKQKKVKIKYVLIGFSLSLIAGIFSNLVLPFIGLNQFVFLGPYTLLFFLSFTAYAIIRHELMDIKVVLRRSFYYAVILFSVLATFSYIHINVPDNTTFIIYMFFIILIGSGGIYLIHRNEINKQKEEFNKEVKHINQQLHHQVLVGGLKGSLSQQTHDIKNPMRNIAACAKELLSYIPRDNEDAKECIQDLLDSQQDALKIIDDLLSIIDNSVKYNDISYISVQNNAEPFAISDVIKKCTLYFKSIVNRLGIIIEYDEVDDSLQVAHMDAKYFESLVKNIFVNAFRELEHTSKPHIKVYTRNNDERYFEVVIWNNGPHIPANRIESIFEEGVSYSDSSGVGLSIIKNALTKPPINGDIWAESSEQEGTSFILRLKKKLDT